MATRPSPTSATPRNPVRHPVAITLSNPTHLVLTSPTGNSIAVPKAKLTGRLSFVLRINPAVKVGYFTITDLLALREIGTPIQPKAEQRTDQQIVADVKARLAPTKKSLAEVEAELNSYDIPA